MKSSTAKPSRKNQDWIQHQIRLRFSRNYFSHFSAVPTGTVLLFTITVYSFKVTKVFSDLKNMFQISATIII